jgi:hypothetical protein
MAIFYTDTGSISDLVVSNSLRATGSLYGSASYVESAMMAEDVNLGVSAGTLSTNVSQLIFSNNNNFSFGLNGSTVTATFSPPQDETFSYYNPRDAYVQDSGTWGNGTLFMQPFQCDNVQFDRVAHPIYISNADNANSTMGLSFSLSFGIYTRNASSLSLLSNYTTNTTFQGTLGSANSSLYRGIRLWTMGLTQTLTEGQYYVGMISSVTNTRGTISNYVISQQTSNFNGIFGQAWALTNQYTRGLGFYSTSTNALPSSVAISQLNGAATYTSVTTGTQVLRPPVFYLVSQTF